MAPRKDPAARIRRTRPATTKVVLWRDADVIVPDVPDGTDGALWAQVWSDPAAQTWTAGDIGALSRWCLLHSVFAEAETGQAAAIVSTEMRQLETALGLGAVARSKLGWTVENPPEPATAATTPDGVIDSAARFRARTEILPGA